MTREQPGGYRTCCAWRLVARITGTHNQSAAHLPVIPVKTRNRFVKYSKPPRKTGARSQRVCFCRRYRGSQPRCVGLRVPDNLYSCRRSVACLLAASASDDRCDLHQCRAPHALAGTPREPSSKSKSISDNAPHALLRCRDAPRRTSMCFVFRVSRSAASLSVPAHSCFVFVRQTSFVNRWVI